jgi:predicted chitinase
LNALADQDNFDRIMRTINGGTNGESDRWAYLVRAKAAFGI